MWYDVHKRAQHADNCWVVAEGVCGIDVHRAYVLADSLTVDGMDKKLPVSALGCTGFLFCSHELTFRGRNKPHCGFSVKNQL